jgi:ribose transport system substrate-binding protein
MRTKWQAILLCGMALAGVAGCNPHAGEKYYLITVNKEVPYWQTAKAGFADSATQLRVSFVFSGPDNYDIKAEQEALRQAIREKPAGILISSAHPQLLQADIDAAIGQQIPVITIDADSPGSKRLYFLGTNNYQAGVMGGEAAVKALGGKGAVYVYTMPNQDNLNERLQGYRAAFDRAPGIKIARVIDIQGDPRVAFDSTQQAIDKKENVDGFICLEALAGKEVATVLSQNRVTGKVVIAMDTDPDTLEWIRKGVIGATVAQKPYTMAYVGLQQLDELHHRKLPSLTGNWRQDMRSPFPAFVDTGAMLISKENIGSLAPSQK